MRLEMVMLAGAESKQFLVDLTKQIDRLEKLTGLAVALKNEKAGISAALQEAEDEAETAAPVTKRGRPKKAAPAPVAAAEEDEDEDADDFGAATDDEDEDEEEAAPAPKKATKGKKAAAAAFDEDEDEEEDAAEDEDEEEAAPAPKKATKAPTAPAGKRLTTDDVNDACKARVKAEVSKRGISGPDARKVVLKILKKFGVASASELEPKQYADVIKAMQG